MKKIVLSCLIFILLALAAGAARQWAPHGISWKAHWPTSSTSAEEAYKLMARPSDPPFISLQDVITLHEKKSAVFIDARSTDEFNAGHVPGARSLPFYEWDEKKEAALDGVDVNTPIVIYCEGVGCELSLFLARELAPDGYSQMKIFYGGYPEWKEAGLPLERLEVAA